MKVTNYAERQSTAQANAYTDHLNRAIATSNIVVDSEKEWVKLIDICMTKIPKLLLWAFILTLTIFASAGSGYIFP